MKNKIEVKEPRLYVLSTERRCKSIWRGSLTRSLPFVISCDVAVQRSLFLESIKEIACCKYIKKNIEITVKKTAKYIARIFAKGNEWSHVITSSDEGLERCSL